MVRLNRMSGNLCNLRRAAGVVSGLLLLGACASGARSGAPPAGATSSTSSLAATRTFGVGPAEELLTLAPPKPRDQPAVSESEARREVDHPFSAPELAHPVMFALTRATAALVGWQGNGAAPVFRSTLAWVGVFEIDRNAPHSCPGGPPASPQSMPPLQAHYYFAVLVDATTNAQATWNEDESGLLMRQCAVMWSGAANPGGTTG